MIHLKLITLSGTEIDEDVYEVMVPTTGGTIGVYGGHAPLLGEVAPGLLSVRKKKADKDDQRDQYGVYDGTVEILNDTIQVLVDELDTPFEVSEQEAQAALKRAEEMISKAKDAVSLSEAQAMMDRQAVRLQLANLKKHSKRKY
ncbi:ATP synthase F1 subunit epsilon [Candidatus Saccharibacteria bacterium]|nr:ATP synthase F1 subunit epsilon [Candidatus Saccharibacteria bacterium]